MGLFGRRRPATLALDTEGPFRATESVGATVTVTDAIDRVERAVVELGYLNGFRYRWAGRADAALRHGDDALLLTGQVGTDHGSERDTEEWVHVLDTPLTVAGGVLGEGAQRVSLRLPSWSPGSSAEVVRWQLRLRVERTGKDVHAEVPLTVLVAAPDPPPTSLDLPLVQGERAVADSLRFEIETERGCYRPGEEVRGTVAVTPTEPVSRTALVAAWFQQVQESHPLDRTPGSATEAFTRPMVTFAKDVQLVQGERAAFSFALTLPVDADPTTEAVHSSIDWWVQVKVEFAGATGAIERARRGIVVHTA